MKIQNIITIIISLALMNLSCLDDITDNGNIYKPAPEGESYISIKVKTGDIDTFTKAGEKPATKEELAVHSIRIVLYDGDENQASQCKVEYVFDIDDPSSLEPNSNELEFMTFAELVKIKSYKMLVIINGRNSNEAVESEIYKVTKKGSFLYQFKQAVSCGLDNTNGVLSGGKGILMTNHQDLVTVDKSQLTKTAEEACASPVQVSVDRLVAKVTLRHANNLTLPKGIDPATVTWGLDITNKKTFWMREGTSGEKNDPTMETLYARDPNFSIFPHNTDTSDEFNSFFDGYYLSPGQITNPLGQYIYTLENTIDTETNAFEDYDDQITRIIVGYKYTPEGFNTNESYYIYQNKVLNQKEINNYLHDESFEIPGLDNLRIVLKELQEENLPLTGKTTNYYEFKGFRYCPEGQIYYIIPIRHFGGAEGSLGRYGVVRNNIYDITIKSLTPPDLAGPYLSADIHVQPWALRGQTNTIGVSLTELPYAPVKVYHWSINDNSNLYQKKWANETGKPIEEAPTFTTKMFRVGNTVYGQSCILTFPSYQYSHSTPQSITVKEGPNSNEIHLFYWLGTIHGGQVPIISVYFADKDGNLLDVRYNTGEPVKYPANIAMYPITYPGDENNGYVYIKYLTNVFNFYKNGIEYEIRDTDYVAYTDKEPENGKITFSNSFYEEPVYAATFLGSSWSAIRQLVIICEPK